MDGHDETRCRDHRIGRDRRALGWSHGPGPLADLFEGSTTTPAKNGATQPIHIVVQSWGIVGQEDKLALRGFCFAHLLSGQISTPIDGETTEHLPGDYWTVKTGASMRVKVVGEVAG